jgi:hypothetical protein
MHCTWKQTAKLQNVLTPANNQNLCHPAYRQEEKLDYKYSLPKTAALVGTYSLLTMKKRVHCAYGRKEKGLPGYRTQNFLQVQTM